MGDFLLLKFFKMFCNLLLLGEFLEKFDERRFWFMFLFFFVNGLFCVYEKLKRKDFVYKLVDGFNFFVYLYVI